MFWASTRRAPVRRADRDQRARVAGLGGSGEPPLLVHQVQGEDAVERDARPLGDPAHLVEQIRRVPLDGGDEPGRLDEPRDERLRRPASRPATSASQRSRRPWIGSRSASPCARPRSRPSPWHSTIACVVTAIATILARCGGGWTRTRRLVLPRPSAGSPLQREKCGRPASSPSSSSSPAPPHAGRRRRTTPPRRRPRRTRLRRSPAWSSRPLRLAPRTRRAPGSRCGCG